MMDEIDPVINNWYQHLDKGQEFRVVAIDPVVGLIEIQHFDGDLDEMDLDAWYDSELELIEEPENWAGALDIDNPDDYGTDITDTNEDDWNEPLNELSEHDNDNTEDMTRYFERGEDTAQDSMTIPFEEGLEENVL